MAHDAARHEPAAGDLEGRVALVTGSGRGIGLEIARTLLKGGASVMLCDLEDDRLATAQAHLASYGDVDARRADVRYEASARDVVAATVDRWGRLDFLVNNAGICRAEPFLTASPANWDAIMAVNARGQFLVGQAAARVMVAARRGGAIVNVASTNGILGEAGQAAYNASKAAVILLTKTMAIELAAAGIRVNSVCPGFIHTDLAAEAGIDADAIRSYASKIPLGRVGAPRDVAEAVAFLLSGRASFITGTELVIDGGQTCHE